MNSLLIDLLFTIYENHDCKIMCFKMGFSGRHANYFCLVEKITVKLMNLMPCGYLTPIFFLSVPVLTQFLSF